MGEQAPKRKVKHSTEIELYPAPLPEVAKAHFKTMSDMTAQELNQIGIDSLDAVRNPRELAYLNTYIERCENGASLESYYRRFNSLALELSEDETMAKTRFAANVQRVSRVLEAIFVAVGEGGELDERVSGLVSLLPESGSLRRRVEHLIKKRKVFAPAVVMPKTPLK